MGKAVVEFQEVGLIPVTLINIPSVDILGLFPTVQSLIPQLILAVFLFGSLFWRIFEGGNKVDKKEKTSTENRKEKNEKFEDTKSLVQKTLVNK
jgi:predicted DNA repair protein MutK